MKHLLGLFLILSLFAAILEVKGSPTSNFVLDLNHTTTPPRWEELEIQKTILPWDYMGKNFNTLQNKVFLSQNELETLLKRYQEGELKTGERLPPTGTWFLGQGSLSIELQGVSVLGKLEFQVEVSGPWTLLPLNSNLQNSLEYVQIKDSAQEVQRSPESGSPLNSSLKTAPLLLRQNWNLGGRNFPPGFYLFVGGKGKMTVTADFRTQLVQNKTRRNFLFNHPVFPGLKCRFTLPEKEFETLESNPGFPIQLTKTGGKILASWENGSRNSTGLTWFTPMNKGADPKGDGKDDSGSGTLQMTPTLATEEKIIPPPMVFSEQNYLLFVDEGYLRGQCHLILNIHPRHPIGSQSLLIPSDLEILEIAGGCLSEDQNKNLIRDKLVFQQKVSGIHHFFFLFEKAIPAGESLIIFNPFKLEGADRDRGHIAIGTQEALKILPMDLTRAGQYKFRRIDPIEIPTLLKEKTTNPILLAYQFSETPFTLEIPFQAFSRPNEKKYFIEKGDLISYFTPENQASRLSLTLKGNLPQFLNFTPPPGANVQKAGSKNELYRMVNGENGQLKIPINDRNSQSKTIWIDWTTQNQIKGWSGSFSYQIPTLETPIHSLYWGIIPPSKGVFTHLNGLFSSKFHQETLISRWIGGIQNFLQFSQNKILTLILMGGFISFLVLVWVVGCSGLFKERLIQKGVTPVGSTFLALLPIPGALILTLFFFGSFIETIDHYGGLVFPGSQRNHPFQRDHFPGTFVGENSGGGDNLKTLQIPFVPFGLKGADGFAPSTQLNYLNRYIYNLIGGLAFLQGLFWAAVCFHFPVRNFLRFCWTLFTLLLAGQGEIYGFPAYGDIHLQTFLFFTFLFGLQQILKFFKRATQQPSPFKNDLITPPPSPLEKGTPDSTSDSNPPQTTPSLDKGEDSPDNPDNTRGLP